MKKTKVEKGITLIALIITIVVLLILAVVTIGAINESKIIEHSKNSSSEYTVAQEKEQIQLALSKWQIQKNTPENTETFKSVIEAELGKNVTVSGSNNGPLNITFNNTGNKYRVTDDGKISEAAKLTGTDLEKYIFGDNLNGRDIMEIMDENGEVFTNPEIELLTSFIEFEDLLVGDVNLINLYIRYKDEIYRFKALSDENEGTIKTVAYYGVIPKEIKEERIGKTVSYDGKKWTIMYDDDTNGLQMICNSVYQSEYYIGRKNHLIIDWDSLITTIDLDKDGKLNNFEKAVYSSNNAINTLNEACANVVPSNENIIDVRSVGSNPTNKNAENATFYTSEKLEKWPENNSTYTSGIGNCVGKKPDLNYISDFERIEVLQKYYEAAYYSGGSYWLASRFVNEYSDEIKFGLRNAQNGKVEENSIFCVNKEEVYGTTGEYGIRPVVKLKSDVQFSGSGTDDDPYTF